MSHNDNNKNGQLAGQVIEIVLYVGLITFIIIKLIKK